MITVKQLLEQLEHKQEVKISKTELRDPLELGFRPAIGKLRGQIRDWRLILDNGKCLHLVEYENYYTAHIDEFDPLFNPIKHFLVDVLRFTKSLNHEK